MKRKPLRYDPKNDYYTLLGLSDLAAPDEIQRAFRQKAKAVHPDLNPDRREWANAQFQRINEAYNVLSDPPLRFEYDDLRRYHRGGAARRPDDAWWNQASNTNPTGHAEGANPANSTRQADSAPFSTPHWQATTPTFTTSRVLRGLMHGPYRYVIAILILVFIANAVFITAVMRQNDSVVAFAQETFAARQTELSATSAAHLVGTSTAYRATNCSSPSARITAPGENAAIDFAALRVIGTATHPQFDYYVLEIASAAGGEANAQIGGIRRESVRDGVLGVSAERLPNIGVGRYVVRLKVYLKDGSQLPTCEVSVVNQ